MDQKRIGQFMRSLRKEKNLTQEQLADALYVSSKTVSRWETAAQLPDLLMLQNIADFFGISVTELLNGERSETDSEEKETLRKLTEYSERKEKRGQTKLWLLIGGLASVLAIVLAFFLIKHFIDRKTTPPDTVSLRPLFELREGYSISDAEYDGCVVIKDRELLYGEKRWYQFLEDARQGKSCLVRIYETTTAAEYIATHPGYFLKELAFDGKRYRLSLYDQTGDTHEWIFTEDTYEFLNEETICRYERRDKAYALSDSSEGTYSEWGRRALSSVALHGATSKIKPLLIFDVSDRSSLQGPAYGVEFANVDGSSVDTELYPTAPIDWDYTAHNGSEMPESGIVPIIVEASALEEKCFLLYGRTSGLFTWSLVIYRQNGTCLADNVYHTDFMDLSFIRTDDGRLAVQGVTQEIEGIRQSETHLYEIVVRDGKAELEESGVVLQPVTWN